MLVTPNQPRATRSTDFESLALYKFKDNDMFQFLHLEKKQEIQQQRIMRNAKTCSI